MQEQLCQRLTWTKSWGMDSSELVSLAIMQASISNERRKLAIASVDRSTAARTERWQALVALAWMAVEGSGGNPETGIKPHDQS